jgi:hypothetical protein
MLLPNLSSYFIINKDMFYGYPPCNKTYYNLVKNVMNIEFFIRPKYYVQFFLFFSQTIIIASTNIKQSKEFEVYFNDGCGRLDVVGKFAGVESHKSPPLPSRISFYYPFTNSIGLSTHCWKHYEFLLSKFFLNTNNQIDFSGNIVYFSIVMYEILRDYVYSAERINFE